MFRLQADGCGNLGSPFYAQLHMHCADDIETGGPIADVLVGHEDDPGPSALALRLVGSAHRVVLDGRAPSLDRYYASVGGTSNADAAWPLFRTVIVDNFDEIRGRLISPPQTNEIGRSAVLLGGLLEVAASYGLPIRLLEIGASAGLNLRLDEYRYELADGISIGPAEADVVIKRPWIAGTDWPRTGAVPVIAQRRGCDTDPVDPTTDDGRRRLMSYVWPDQTARFSRLRAALLTAARVPVAVERMSAADFLARELAVRTPGVATVVWHSIVWQYVPHAERTEIERTITDAGRRATESAPLVRFALEPRRVEGRDGYVGHAFVAALTSWPGGDERLIGEAGGHGPPVRWGWPGRSADRVLQPA